MFLPRCNVYNQKRVATSENALASTFLTHTRTGRVSSAMSDHQRRVSARGTTRRQRTQPTPAGPLAFLRVRASGLRRSRTSVPVVRLPGASVAVSDRLRSQHSCHRLARHRRGMERPAARIIRGRPVLPSATARREAPEAVLANAPRQRHPGNPLPAVPGRGPSRAHTAPVRARPYPVPGIPPAQGIRPGCGRPRPSLPGTPISGARCCPPCGAPSLDLKLVQTEVPRGLAASSAAAAGTAPRKHLAAVPRIPCR